MRFKILLGLKIVTYVAVFYAVVLGLGCWFSPLVRERAGDRLLMVGSVAVLLACVDTLAHQYWKK